MEMGCFGCFGFSRRRKAVARPRFIWSGFTGGFSQQNLLPAGHEEDEEEEEDDGMYNGESTSMTQWDENETPHAAKRSEEVISFRIKNGLICRQFAVKETCVLVRSEDEDGNKKINEYVREFKIGSGSYAKVVLYRSSIDWKHYAIKAFHKSHLLKQRVAPSETAMTDVLREVLIMKIVSHPNIVNLIEVIDDPDFDHFYMVLEYVEEKWDHEGAGPPGGLGETTARKYLRDILSGLIYLHSHNIVHLDIKPQNLLVTRNGTVKIADFSVSQVVELSRNGGLGDTIEFKMRHVALSLISYCLPPRGDNDELRRSPGTPVITAPECCLGVTYRGKPADTWAVGVTLHCMITGRFPFIAETLQDTYDKIVNDSLHLPDDINPKLGDLLEGLLCKDPKQRMTLEDAAEHPWVLGEEGPLPEFSCWCKRNNLKRDSSNVDVNDNTLQNGVEF